MSDGASETSTIGSGPIKVAVLDDYPALSAPYWNSLPADVLSQLSITIYTANLQNKLSSRADGDELQSLLAQELLDYSVICTMRERTPFPATLINQLPQLKYLLTTAMRNLALDLPAFKDRGVIVTGTKPSSKPPSNWPYATTQHTWALILALASNIPRDDLHTRSTDTGGRGTWLNDMPLNMYLPGKTFGALGLGRLGGEAAKIAVLAWGMKVVTWSENLTQEKADELAMGQGLEKGTYQVAKSKEALFRESDVLSVHLVLGDRSRGSIGQKELGWMKKSAILINTSRGPIIDESALLKVLGQGGIRGAGLDVFDIEPLPSDSPWRTTKWGEEGRSQVVITPHAGYNYEETMREFWEGTVRNVQRYVNGEEVENRMV